MTDALDRLLTIFKTAKPYASERTARKVIATAKSRNLIPDGINAFVACDRGQFFPIVVYRDGIQINIPALCTLGCVVTS